MTIDASTLFIVNYPAPVLRKKAAPVPAVTDEVRAVAMRMIQLMREAEGIGLAAPQVGLPWRLFIAHVPPEEGRSTDSDPPTANREPRVYINPIITKPEGALVTYSEGCLSLPDIRGDVARPPIVTITATNLDGKEFSERGAGLLARCWQHEVDHLDGVLIIDRMSQISRLKNKSAIRDLERSGAKR